MFRFAAGGVGGAANKNDRKFLGFAPRELVERDQGACLRQGFGRQASVIRQNPADFVRNTFELRPIPIFNFGGEGEIRTRDALSDILVFKTSALNQAQPPLPDKLKIITD